MLRILWLKHIIDPAKDIRLVHFRRYVLERLSGVKNVVYVRRAFLRPPPPQNEVVKLRPGLRTSEIKRRATLGGLLPRPIPFISSLSATIPRDLLFRRYDLIYTHMLSSFQTITTFFIGHIIRRKPFVVMTEHWHLRKSRTVNRWYRTVSRSARLVVAQSTRSRRFFVEVLGVPHERVVTCVNTVGDLDALPYAEEIEAELRGRATFKVLCVARFKEVKGQDNLISAFRQIDGDDIELILVGEHATDFGQECVKIASGDDRIRFQGAAPFESVLAFYRACDLFVLPNRFTKDPLEGAESFGYAALEAAYLGLPIILSGATGCAEDLVIEGVTGRQVAEGSPEALRAALTELFAAPDQVKRMGVAAKEHARGLCSDATIEGFASALEDILDELGRQPSVPAS